MRDPYVQTRGWPPGWSAPRGESRYGTMCRQIDEASTVEELRTIREEAEEWLGASAGCNLLASKEAAAARDRASRRLAELTMLASRGR
jgi:hypothetical protein